MMANERSAPADMATAALSSWLSTRKRETMYIGLQRGGEWGSRVRLTAFQLVWECVLCGEPCKP
jgi:hypothetical protein